MMFASAVVFAAKTMLSKLMTFPKLTMVAESVISVISIRIIFIAIVVVRVIITIAGVISCTTCQEEPEYERY